jgi:hypothetical protein
MMDRLIVYFDREIKSIEIRRARERDRKGLELLNKGRKGWIEINIVRLSRVVVI